MPGLWEFPGGKCEPGETPEAATVRECLEETGLVVRIEGLRRVVDFVYPHGHVLLHYFDCAPVDKTDEPLREAGFQWVEAVRLSEFEFPPANDVVVAELVEGGSVQC
jgi:mutator protein MutT